MGARIGYIVVAAGSGSRLGASEPKAFVPISGEPMLAHSLRTIAGLNPLRQTGALRRNSWLPP